MGYGSCRDHARTVRSPREPDCVAGNHSCRVKGVRSCRVVEFRQAGQLLQPRVRHLRPADVQPPQALERGQLLDPRVPGRRVPEAQCPEALEGGQLLHPRVGHFGAGEVQLPQPLEWGLLLAGGPSWGGRTLLRPFVVRPRDVRRRVGSRDHHGKFVRPIRYRSHSRAAPRPSLIAHTTRLWPRRMSPAANTPGTLVANRPYSALALLRGSFSTPSLSSSCGSGPRKPIASNTSWAGKTFSDAGTSRGTIRPLSRAHSMRTVCSSRT